MAVFAAESDCENRGPRRVPAAPRVAPRCNDRPAIEKFRWCLRRVETSVRGFGRSLSVLKEPRDLCDSLELSTVSESRRKRLSSLSFRTKRKSRPVVGRWPSPATVYSVWNISMLNLDRAGARRCRGCWDDRRSSNDASSRSQWLLRSRPTMGNETRPFDTSPQKRQNRYCRWARRDSLRGKRAFDQQSGPRGRAIIRPNT